MAREIPGYTPEKKGHRNKRGHTQHPQTDRIVAAYAEAMIKLAAGEISAMPSLASLGRANDASVGTVIKVLEAAELYTRSKRDYAAVEETVVTYIQEQLAAGRGLPSYSEMREMFGLRRQTLMDIVKRNELQADVVAAKEAAKIKEFLPSQETAWFLGAMVGSGRVDNNADFIFTNDDPKVREAFVDTAERILGVQGIEESNTQGRAIAFHSTAYGRALGDFHEEERTNTIIEKHGWTQEEEYLNSFASGLFDATAKLRNSARRAKLEFYTGDSDVARFYLDMLIRMGVQKPRMIGDPDNETLKGVGVYNLADLITFANTITSVSPDKEQALEAIKQREKMKKTRAKVSSPQEVIDQWRKLTIELGHSPSSMELLELRGTNREVFPLSVLIKFFGTPEDGGKPAFSVARKKLDAIIVETSRVIDIFP